jgi:hypothetical protein
MRTVSYTFTARDAAGHAAEWTEQVQVDDAPTNPDFGRNLRSWILQAGGQELVLPAGTYSASAVAAGTAGAAHADWLVLRAASQGAVVVDDDVELRGVSRVAFVGIDFRYRFWLADGGCDVVTWRCDHSNPTGDGATNTTRPGVFVNGGRLTLCGADIHDCTKDGVHMSASASAQLRMHGCRVWNIADPANEDHCDALQVRGGNALVEDSVFGLTPAGQPAGNGHTQVQSDVDAADVTFRRHWSTASGNYGFTGDAKNSGRLCVIRRETVRSWGHNFGDLTLGGGATHQSTDVVTAAGAGMPPDSAWRAANPYGSCGAWLAGSGL